MQSPRIAPIAPPYAPEVQKLFDLVMPAGMDPLLLFRVLARSPRVFPRFMRAGVLDRGPVDVRDRELVIHRTTARCDAEYEWGVHVAAFARPLGFSEAWVRATRTAACDDSVWSDRERCLVRLCDELHETSTVSAALWQELDGRFDADQLLELIYTVGLYHAVSYLTNALALPREAGAPGFPERS